MKRLAADGTVAPLGACASPMPRTSGAPASGERLEEGLARRCRTACSSRAAARRASSTPRAAPSSSRRPLALERVEGAAAGTPATGMARDRRRRRRSGLTHAPRHRDCSAPEEERMTRFSSSPCEYAPFEAISPRSARARLLPAPRAVSYAPAQRPASCAACGGRRGPYPRAMTAAAQTPEAAKPATANGTSNARLARHPRRRAQGRGARRTKRASSRSRSSSGPYASARTAIAQAIARDFGNRSKHETFVAEIFVLLGEIRHAKAAPARLDGARRSARRASSSCPRRASILHQPLGVIGIISPVELPGARSPSGRSSPRSPRATAP